LAERADVLLFKKMVKEWDALKVELLALVSELEGKGGGRV